MRGIDIRKVFTSFVNIDSFGSLGGFCITSGSGGLSPSAKAGNPSVARFTYKIWTGRRKSKNF